MQVWPRSSRLTAASGPWLARCAGGGRGRRRRCIGCRRAFAACVPAPFPSLPRERRQRPGATSGVVGVAPLAVWATPAAEATTKAVPRIRRRRTSRKAHVPGHPQKHHARRRRRVQMASPPMRGRRLYSGDAGWGALTALRPRCAAGQARRRPRAGYPTGSGSLRTATLPAVCDRSGATRATTMQAPPPRPARRRTSPHPRQSAARSGRSLCRLPQGPLPQPSNGQHASPKAEGDHRLQQGQPVGSKTEDDQPAQHGEHADLGPLQAFFGGSSAHFRPRGGRRPQCSAAAAPLW